MCVFHVHFTMRNVIHCLYIVCKSSSGHFGLPTLNVSVFLGMMAATFTSILESMGDYYATARVSQLPPPPKHAMNRGIANGGLGSLIAALIGSSHGTTSYSVVAGIIAYTGVSSKLANLV